MATRGAIIAQLARNAIPIPGLKAIYAPEEATGVKRIPDSLSTLPAAVFLPGATTIMPASWERQTWIIRGSIWTGETPRGERVAELVDLQDSILGVFRVPVEKLTTIDPAVQSVLVTEFDLISVQQWQARAELPFYLVMPFTIEMKVNRPVTYGPV
jgi:hypothetical protein